MLEILLNNNIRDLVVKVLSYVFVMYINIIILA